VAHTFRREPALAAGLIQRSHDVGISVAADHRPVVIRLAGDSGGEFDECLPEVTLR
jgi:hypothetical protein